MIKDYHVHLENLHIEKLEERANESMRRNTRSNLAARLTLKRRPFNATMEKNMELEARAQEKKKEDHKSRNEATSFPPMELLE